MGLSHVHTEPQNPIAGLLPGGATKAAGLVEADISQEALFSPRISNLAFNEALTLLPVETSVLIGPQKSC